LAGAVDREVKDCVIIGGGPAGLTAAIYLARYHLSVTVFDDSTSRAAKIPISHNHAGFPDGISGLDLLARMRAQAVNYGVEVRGHTVSALQNENGLYVVASSGGSLRCRSVLMATGVFNLRPTMPTAKHDEAVARGLLRYCPVCDGFEVTDKAVGVIGAGSKGFKEAMFLRSYTKDIVLLSPDEKHGLSDVELAHLNELGIRTERGPITSIDLQSDTIRISTPLGAHVFASVYAALGSKIRSELASEVGARLSDDGCILVDNHQRTTVPGLYAAGDVVIGLDQISHSMGQAGVAATAIRNDLCEASPLLR
jgi:thioredoxin reductase (NADPH)